MFCDVFATKRDFKKVPSPVGEVEYIISYMYTHGIQNISTMILIYTCVGVFKYYTVALQLLVKSANKDNNILLYHGPVILIAVMM